MILGAFNNIISNSSLSLEEARGQVRDSVDKEFKSKILFFKNGIGKMNF